MDAPPPAGSSPQRSHLILPLVLAAVVIGGIAYGLATEEPRFSGSPEPAAGAITLHVDSCRPDSATHSATAEVTFTSSRSFRLVTLTGDLTDESGEVVGQGIGNESNVQPGLTYHASVLYIFDTVGMGSITCNVHVDSAV